MITTEQHAEIATRRASVTADYLTANADVLARHRINVAREIARITDAAASGVPAYVAMDPILALADRIVRISDRLTGTVVSRGGRDILTSNRVSRDGDVLLEVAMNLSANVPADHELYRHHSS